MRADRLLALMALLRRHGRLSAPELARRLEVDRRTVLRDIDALSTAGVPVYAERGRNGGFSLLPGYVPDAEELSPAEARALFVAGGQQAIERLGLSGQLASALRKLSSALPDEHHQQVSHTTERLVIDAAGWLADPTPVPFLDTVQQAVFGDRRLRIGYTPKNIARAGERTVDPYGLLLAGGTWYVVAAHRGQPRSYRVSRITSALVLEQPSTRPADLDLRALWSQMRADFRGGEGISVVLQVDDARAELVQAQLALGLTRPAVATETEDGVRIEAQVRSLRGAAGVLAGFGGAVEVVAPTRLQLILVQLADEILATYDQP